MHTLPLHTLTALRPHVASLERMGCRTWGALRALPRAGLARRLGAGVLRVLDQALGEAPEAHAWLELPEQFALTAELPALATSADALLWSAHRCLTALQGWLQARQQGALALELAWRHDLRRIDGVVIAPTQALQVRTAKATQDMAHLRRLLAEMRKTARVLRKGLAHVQAAALGVKVGRQQGPRGSLVATGGHEGHVVWGWKCAGMVT